jgi:predicted phage terminase large subunit-like protein
MADLYATAEAAARAGRGSFVTYRRLVRPTMLWGWWVEQIALELQLFYEALVAGERPMLAIVTPPQHGKSWSVGTRWHIDDPIGRLIDREPRLRTLTYPAIAEADDGFRRKGEALFPALKPLDFLLERKSLMSEPSWQSVYQGHPYLVGGGMFPVELFRTIRVFDRHEIKASVLAVDKAGTAGGDGAYTAIVLMHKMKNGQFVIERVAHGHWSALEREIKIKQYAETDRESMRRIYSNYTIVVEQEPGSGGKESAEATIRNLAGYNVIAYKPTGDKAVRAEPLAAQVQGGNVLLHAGSWHEDFLEEAESWPNSPQLDQIDAAAMAFNHLTLRDTYDQSYSAFRD